MYLSQGKTVTNPQPEGFLFNFWLAHVVQLNHTLTQIQLS
jgi:hypothetical protein